jgi:hypothetical protein
MRRVSVRWSHKEDMLTCKSSMTTDSDEQVFHIGVKRELFVNGTLTYGKSWEDTITRNLP